MIIIIIIIIKHFLSYLTKLYNLLILSKKFKSTF